MLEIAFLLLFGDSSHIYSTYSGANKVLSKNLYNKNIQGPHKVLPILTEELLNERDNQLPGTFI